MYLDRAQLLTSLTVDVCRDINGGFVFSCNLFTYHLKATEVSATSSVEAKMAPQVLRNNHMVFMSFSFLIR